MERFTLENSFGFLVNRAAIKMKSQLLSSFKQNGYELSTEQWGVLICLWEKDTQTQTDIAEKLVKDKTNLTRILDGMEKKELIIRKPHENDRRSYRIHLTEKGRELAKKLIPIAEKENETCTRMLNSQEKQEVVRLMNRIYYNL